MTPQRNKYAIVAILAGLAFLILWGMIFSGAWQQG